MVIYVEHANRASHWRFSHVWFTFGSREREERDIEMNSSIERLFRDKLPPAAKRWAGFPKFNFVGGHVDRDAIPVEELVSAATAILRKKGPELATYHMDSGPQGLLQLREFVARRMKRDRGIECNSDHILITSGSVQGLDLVNSLLLQPGDTVVTEEFTFGLMLNMIRGRGAQIVAAPLDEFGIRTDALERVLDDLKDQGIVPKFIYTIPTVQNPTGSVMPLERRRALVALAEARGIPILEDDCYADLVWKGDWPPSLASLSQNGSVVHVGSFSKTIAPALRLGYLIADWTVMSRLLPLKVDGGTSGLEQMLVAEYCVNHFDTHIEALRGGLKAKLAVLIDAIDREFGAAVELTAPNGGIFVWLRLPDAVDTSTLFTASALEGVAFDPGADWAVTPERARHHLRLCFASASEEEIYNGVAKLAEICQHETGIPLRRGNLDLSRT
ncbi:MAG: PLP-dependent aminotransferase family protein [Rhizobiaceae bacterium]